MTLFWNIIGMEKEYKKNKLHQIRPFIAKWFETETRLIDAQTFMWIIIEKILKDNSAEE